MYKGGLQWRGVQRGGYKGDGCKGEGAMGEGCKGGPRGEGGAMVQFPYQIFIHSPVVKQRCVDEKLSENVGSKYN